MSDKRYVLIGAVLVISLIGGTVFALDSSLIAQNGASESSNDEYITNEKSNLTHAFDQKDQELKNWRSNVANQKKCTPSFDTAALEGYWSSWGMKISEGRALIDLISIGDSGPIATAWSKDNELNDLRYDINDEVDKINQACDNTNKQNSCEERRKEYDRNMATQLKDIQRRKGSSVLDLTPLTSLTTQFKQCVDTLCTPDGVAKSTFWDDMRGCEYNRDDFYTTINELNETANKEECRLNAQNWVKDTDRDLNRNIKREYDRLVKDAKGDLSGYKKTYEDMQALFITIQSSLTSFTDCNDFGNIQRDFDDLRNDFWEKNKELQEVTNAAQQSRDILRNIKDRQRDHKNMERELKNITRRLGKEPTELKGFLDCAVSKTADAEKTATSDPQSGWDLLSDAGNCSNDFWNTQRDYQEQANVVEQCGTHIARELKDWQREIKRISRESIRTGNSKSVSGLEEYVKRFQSLKDEMCGGTDLDRAQDIQLEIQDLRQEWWEAVQASNEDREFKFFDDRIKEITREIEHVIKKLSEIKISGQHPTEKMEFCGKIVSKAKSLVEKMNEAYAAKDRVEVQDTIEELEFLRGQAGPQCGFLFGNRGDRQDIDNILAGVDLEGVQTDVMGKVLERISNELIDKVVTRILAQQEAVIQSLMGRVQERLEQHMATVLESVSVLTEDNQNLILQAKNEVLGSADQLRQVASRINNADLNAVLDHVEKAVVDEDTAQQMDARIVSFVNETSSLSGRALSEAVIEMDNDINELLALSTERLYQRKIVPYKDVPLDQWFARHVIEVTNDGIAAGKKDQSGNLLGIFSPGEKVKISEMLRMVFESSGQGPADGIPDYMQARDHWARGYVKRAEEVGISLVQGHADINREATRAEVCRIILEVQGIIPASVFRVDFPDVAVNHRDAAYIQGCKNMGLFEGDGQGRFRPDDGINRAEAAKVIRAAKSLSINDEDASQNFENFQGFEFDIKIDTGEEEDDLSSGNRSRCWWDNKCTDLISSQLLTEGECSTAGGKGLGPDQNNCKEL
ncbi:MAG: S-layer homology domain-containing protein [Patescibacteria group bacterium]